MCCTFCWCVTNLLSEYFCDNRLKPNNQVVFGFNFTRMSKSCGTLELGFQEVMDDVVSDEAQQIQNEIEDPKSVWLFYAVFIFIIVILIYLFRPGRT